MPLLKRKDGWYWGSKGPFNSKAKALQVARAAYAHGYKGEAALQVGGGSAGMLIRESVNFQKADHKKISRESLD